MNASKPYSEVANKTSAMIYYDEHINVTGDSNNWYVGPYKTVRVGKYDLCRKQLDTQSNTIAFVQQTSRCSVNVQVNALLDSGYKAVILVNIFPAPVPFLNITSQQKSVTPVCFVSEATAFNLRA